MNILSPWTFWHKDFLARGHFGTRYFGTWTFRHMDIWAPCKAIWTFWHRHFGTCATVPKCPCAEMSSCRNIHGAQKSLCQKVRMMKSPWTKMPMCRNAYRAKSCTGQNVPVMKYLAEMLGAEMVGSLSTLPDVVVENWMVEWYQWQVLMSMS